ncbi:MAG: hydrogenase maturation nickel metallochaperone HypA [Candidatus Methanomethylicus sp.]|nr:hydrogenase maturation nickel metallochaperone HypA [Candidatus Methanomethylicus sp.]
MHELSLATNLIDYLEKLGKEQGLNRINEVFIEVGELTHIDPRQLRFSLKIASEGTLAAQSKFFIKRKKVVIKCKKCGKGSQLRTKEMIAQYSITCPLCGSSEVGIDQGREMVLKRVRGIKK